MAISERRRLTFTAIAVILVGIITGLLLGKVLLSGSPPTKTFNIVPYNWGFALYDEDWNEIEQIEVKRGTKVRLVAFPLSVLSDEIREQLWQRVADKGFGPYPPGDPRIPDLVKAGFANPAYASHGVFIKQVKADLRPKEHAASLEEAIDIFEFTTDAVGAFDISCSLFCGIGHGTMIEEKAFVVK